MNKPYQLIIDIWEGRWDLDWQGLDPQLSGAIVRLNDMNGGHHMDTKFSQNWANANKYFEYSSIYFVYNPWVNGVTNYQWLKSHLPSDVNVRLGIDIEVRKTDYPPVTYAAEVQNFFRAMESDGKSGMIYTGAWFLPNVAYWPKDVYYWWAAYSLALTATTTWTTYRSVLESLNFSNWTKYSPGPCKLWQCTGDKCVLPGFKGQDVDVNVFEGSLEDWALFLGAKPPVHEPTTEEIVEDLVKRVTLLEADVEKLKRVALLNVGA